MMWFYQKLRKTCIILNFHCKFMNQEFKNNQLMLHQELKSPFKVKYIPCRTSLILLHTMNNILKPSIHFILIVCSQHVFLLVHCLNNKHIIPLWHFQNSRLSCLVNKKTKYTILRLCGLSCKKYIELKLLYIGNSNDCT